MVDPYLCHWSTHSGQERGLGGVGQVKNQSGERGGQQLAVDDGPGVRAGIVDDDGDDGPDGGGGEGLSALKDALDGSVALLVVQGHGAVAGLGALGLLGPRNLREKRLVRRLFHVIRMRI